MPGLFVAMSVGLVAIWGVWQFVKGPRPPEVE
jgi:hypothetical protein